MPYLRVFAFASILALSGAPAIAADAPGSMSGMSGMTMPGMMGMHDMAATVTTIDGATGLIDVDAGGMKLRLHFPPSALVNVKAGDKIILHLSFTKP